LHSHHARIDFHFVQGGGAGHGRGHANQPIGLAAGVLDRDEHAAGLGAWRRCTRKRMVDLERFERVFVRRRGAGAERAGEQKCS
jgi:hypothetical protein